MLVREYLEERRRGRLDGVTFEDLEQLLEAQRALFTEAASTAAARTAGDYASAHVTLEDLTRRGTELADGLSAGTRRLHELLERAGNLVETLEGMGALAGAAAPAAASAASTTPAPTRRSRTAKKGTAKKAAAKGGTRGRGSAST